jgi:hypothetical protein
VTVTDSLPAGLTATAISGASGSGWNCTLSSLTCTNSGALASRSSYGAITVTVNVSASAPAGTVTNRASVTNAGNTNNASDPTLIVLPSNVTLNASPTASTLGQRFTMTATVNSGATGKVLFRDGVIPLGYASIAGTQAAFTASLLSAGTRSLIVFYDGDATHASSVSRSHHGRSTTAPPTRCEASEPTHTVPARSKKSRTVEVPRSGENAAISCLR